MTIAHLFARRLDVPGRIKPAHARQFEVHHDDVGVEVACEPDGLLAIRRLADHTEVRFTTQHEPQRPADAPAVIDEQNADRRVGGSVRVVLDASHRLPSCAQANACCHSL